MMIFGIDLVDNFQKGVFVFVVAEFQMCCFTMSDFSRNS